MSMLTRRQLIAGAATAAVSAVLPRKLARADPPPFETKLPIPDLIDARSQGNAVRLIAAKGQHAFIRDRPTATYGYSAPVLGPAIRVRRGDEVELTVENRIDRNTIAHWHGVLVPSDRDGSPHDIIAPGKSWRPVLKIDQPETTAWFHPHPHADTARQVYFGFAGLLLIDDGSGERLGLPRAYGIDDLPIVLQDRRFEANGALAYDTGPMATMQGMRGDTIVVNGAVAPVARVPAAIVRLRFLNGANARTFSLGLADGRTFHVICSDGGYLAAPVAMSRLTISPGERFEVLVDFSDGKAVVLETGPDEYAPMMGMMARGAGSTDAIMKFEPDRAMTGAVTTLPSALVEPVPADASQAIRRRRFVLDDMMGMMRGGGMGMSRMGGEASATMGINGRAFDLERIDVEAKLGTSEVWEVASGMLAHPFHVHGALFKILSIDDRAPPAHLQGWKDTVLVPRRVEILVRFTQPATPRHPFMFHCHILEHEDAGMMGQYICT
jgi:blue copper oxidase